MAVEPAMDEIRQPGAPDGPVDRAITWGLGLLILVALIALAAGVEYQIRLWLLVAGVVFCPASLVARIVVGRYGLITFVTGTGVGVAGLMVLGQAMLVAQAWLPVLAAYAVLLIGLGAAAWLLRDRWLLLRERWLPSGWRRATATGAPDSVHRTEEAAP
jgi:hypothetical protein